MQMVTLTDIAAEKVRDFMQGQTAEGDIGLRVGVRGGGCSGFQYALALDEQRDDYHVFDSSGIRVLVDPASLRYVEGSTVDYTENFMGSGFEVKNPNVVASCGCGSSFRVADEEPSCGSLPPGLARAGDALRNPVTGQRLVFLKTAADTDGDLLEMETWYRAGGPRAPAHYHPKQDERFEVLSGAVQCVIDGEERVLREGEVLEVPRGTRHEFGGHPDEDAHVRWE